MFRKFVQFLDSLFWETRIITTITTFPVAEATEVVEVVTPPLFINEGFRLMTNTDMMEPNTVHLEHRVAIQTGSFIDGNSIHIDGFDPIKIPMKLMTRPFLIKDGMVDRKMHPSHPQTPFVVCVNTQDRKFAFANGQPLSRNGSIDGVGRKSAFLSVAKASELIEKKSLKQGIATYDDLDISVCLYKEWLYIEVRSDDGWYLRLIQDNVGQFKDHESCICNVYAAIRCVLLEMDGCGIDILKYDEDKLFLSIIPYLLTK